MVHGIMRKQMHCLYLRDSVSVRTNMFYMFPYKYNAIGAKTLEIMFSASNQ